MLVCMRTTVDICDELFRLAKRKAADEGVPLRTVMESALRNYLIQRPSAKKYRLQWTPAPGTTRPGIDLDDRNTLFEVMENRK